MLKTKKFMISYVILEILTNRMLMLPFRGPVPSTDDPGFTPALHPPNLPMFVYSDRQMQPTVLTGLT